MSPESSASISQNICSTQRGRATISLTPSCTTSPLIHHSLTKHARCDACSYNLAAACLLPLPPPLAPVLPALSASSSSVLLYNRCFSLSVPASVHGHPQSIKSALQVVGAHNTRIHFSSAKVPSSLTLRSSVRDNIPSPFASKLSKKLVPDDWASLILGAHGAERWRARAGGQVGRSTAE